MYLNKFQEKATGRIFLTYKESIRKNGRNATRTVESIGYLDELEKEHEDPIAHFKAEARRRTEEKKASSQKISVVFEGDALLPLDMDGGFDRTRNLGSVFIMKLIHETGLENVFRRMQKRTRARSSIFEVMKLLVYQRILDPYSKKSDFEARGRYFEKMDFSLDDVYRSLSYMNDAKREILERTDMYARERLGRRTGFMFYDVTNYFFEIEDEDGFRMHGCGKEHRPLPIVQMGMFMDEAGLPVSYKLFKGNTNDCQTLLPSMSELRDEFGTGHMVVVADKGMYSGDNICRILLDHNGYVISGSVRKASEDVCRVVYDEDGYRRFDGKGRELAADADETLVSFKYKAWDYVDAMYVTDVDGNRKKLDMNKRRIIYWSRKYARRAKVDRMAAVEKAVAKAGGRSTSKIDNRHGANRYLRTEIADGGGNRIGEYDATTAFDFDRLAQDEKADGYYIIETNVRGMREGDVPFEGESRWVEEEGMLLLNRTVTDRDIIDMYRGLWRIEQNFRITKTGISARPVFLSRRDRIEAHFLTCFLSLFIVRAMQRKMEEKNVHHSCFRIIEELRKLQAADMDGTNFLLLHYSRLIQDLKDATGVDGIKNVMTRGELRKICGDAKKTS